MKKKMLIDVDSSSGKERVVLAHLPYEQMIELAKARLILACANKYPCADSYDCQATIELHFFEQRVLKVQENLERLLGERIEINMKGE